MRTPFSVLTIFLVASVIACKPPPEIEVRGDVFVVTKGGQSVKLGLVRVGFIPEGQIAPVVSAKMDQARVQVQKLEESKKAAQAESRDADSSEKWGKGVMGMAEIALRIARDLGGRRYKEVQRKYDAQQLEYLKAMKRNVGALEAYHKILKDIAVYKNGCFFAADLPQVVQADKTDADGRFSVKLKAGRYAAVAVADRQVGGEQEAYCWYVWITVSGETMKKLMLSNDNLAETNCADCVLPLEKLAVQPNAVVVAPPDAGIAAASVAH